MNIVTVPKTREPHSLPLRLCAALLLVVMCLALGVRVSAATVDYALAIQKIEAAVQAELSAGEISGVSIALVDDQRIVYARGFGLADKSKKLPARTDTVYRCGSISKLFTAIATMQLIEQNKLNLDKPVTRYAPTFSIVNPFPDASPITLRQLLCHRSGLVREAPVGGYFDASEPGAVETVLSLASCVLVYPPGTKTKYSNSGITLVGHAVNHVSGEPFVHYQQGHVLDPIGMTNSSFLLRKALKPRLAKGYLPVADGRGGFREIEAPHFEFGILPAGNLYTTVEDLGRFLSCLFAQGRAGDTPILKPETLAEMFTPQLTGETNGFGLGFNVGFFRGRKTVSHMGAVYGFTSLVTGMSEEKLGVVVLCNDDIAVGAVRKLGQLAYSVMVEARFGETPPARPARFKIAAGELAVFAGEYESESFWAEIKSGPDGLLANISGQRMVLTPVGPQQFEADGRLAREAPVVFERNPGGTIKAFTALNQKFRRVDPSREVPIPDAWWKFLGSYGPDFIPLIVTTRHGHLYAMTENEYDNRLWPLNRFTFKMPPGIYTDEQIVFQPGVNGKIHSAVLANMTLKRR